tara:strand:- start:178 stop:711 length:534 start_codon:yes stop_codon:yes gene_type:complete
MTHTYTENIPNQMSKEDFVAVFGGVYEHSAWIAEEVWELDPDPDMVDSQDTADGIHTAFRMVLDRAGNNAKLTLLRAHPDLAGKLAVSGELTEESTSEQASADLGNCTPEEFEAFQNLNNDYKERFGFPFILAVRGYHRTEILETFRDRVNNDWETEFKTALEQVHRIALLRLNDIA